MEILTFNTMLESLFQFKIESKNTKSQKWTENNPGAENAEFLALVFSAKNHLRLPLCSITLSMLYEKSLVGLSPLPNLRPLKSGTIFYTFLYLQKRTINFIYKKGNEDRRSSFPF